MTDDRIAEIREWRQHAYEWGSLGKAEAAAIDDLLGEIERQKGFREESERQLQAPFEANAEAVSQVSRLREQVAQLEDENEAAGRMINQRDGIIRRRDANLARVEAAMSEAEFHGYDTHDIGRAYCADSVDDLLSDLRAALSPVTQPAAAVPVPAETPETTFHDPLLADVLMAQADADQRHGCAFGPGEDCICSAEQLPGGHRIDDEGDQNR